MEQLLCSPCASKRQTPRQRRALYSCLLTSAAALLVLAAMTAVCALAGRAAFQQPQDLGLQDPTLPVAELEVAGLGQAQRAQARSLIALPQARLEKTGRVGVAARLVRPGHPTLLQGRAPALANLLTSGAEGSVLARAVAGSEAEVGVGRSGSSARAGGGVADTLGKCGELRVPKARTGLALISSLCETL